MKRTVSVYGSRGEYYGTTECDDGVVISTAYCGDYFPLAVPPRAMPVRPHKVECRHCHVTQEMPEIGLCACCGAPL